MLSLITGPLDPTTIGLTVKVANFLACRIVPHHVIADTNVIVLLIAPLVFTTVRSAVCVTDLLALLVVVPPVLTVLFSFSSKTLCCEKCY